MENEIKIFVIKYIKRPKINTRKKIKNFICKYDLCTAQGLLKNASNLDKEIRDMHCAKHIVRYVES